MMQDSANAERNTPIRVMRIIARLNVGGPAIHVSLLTAGLQDAGFASTLVTGVLGPDEADMSYLARDLGVEPVIIPTLQREIVLFDDLKALIRLVSLMRREKPHVVHTHTAKAGLVGRLAARIAGVPVIVHTFHGHVFHGYFGALKTNMFIWLERAASRLSNLTLTISDRLRHDLIHYRIDTPKRIRVLPLGLNLQSFSDVDALRGGFRHEMNFSTDTRLIGIIGRLVPIKNHHLFLMAAQKVVKALPDVCFVIVGGGECQPELEALTGELGLDNLVRFAGWRQDLPAIYADLDLVVISSNNEGTPVSLIEAMSAGVPVVSTAVGGVPDLLCHGELGLLTPPDDVNALANAMIETLRNPVAGRVEAARRHALAQYGIERLIHDVRNLYLELLAQKGI
jgi:glycosyltransferase involved in cell wall biosynthesis